jgi:hypothetical protein
MRKPLALCIPALAALLAVTSWQPALAASDFATFATPSHGIGCVYSDGFLRCDVNGGVVLLPPRCTNADHHGFFISRGQAHSF